MKFLAYALIAAALLQCEEKQGTGECSQIATVIDLSGLDGCGMVLELPNGRKLVPERRHYIMPPKPEEDPLYYFPLKAGEKVVIGYRLSDGVSACMNGNIVFITCIKRPDSLSGD
jgi:hypothetical protein